MTAQITLKKIQQFQEVMNSEINVTELNGKVRKEQVRLAFQEEYQEAYELVKKTVEKLFGKDEQYLFWVVFENLNCPTGCELAFDILKPLQDLEIL